MAIVAQQVAILAILALVGYVLVKTGKADAQHAKLLSALVVYVCFPCTVFRTFSNQFTVDYLSNNYQPLLLSIALVTVVTITAKKASKLFSWVQPINNTKIILEKAIEAGYRPCAKCMKKEYKIWKEKQNKLQ